MATRRKTTKGKAGHGRTARRKAPARKGSQVRRRSAGTRRQAPDTAAAREVRAREGRVDLAEAEGEPRELPPLRLAEPSVAEEAAGGSEARDREAADLARHIEDAVSGAQGALRTGPAEAAAQLRKHREEMEEAARDREASRELPGAASIGLELAIGALRLVRTMATAPLRIGLAFLRRGGASAS
jgi:hypothetical protein